MHWNHRVIEYVNPQTNESWLALHEVYYDAENKPMSYTMEPVPLCSETREGMLETLERMRRALDKPFLRETDFSHGSTTNC